MIYFVSTRLQNLSRFLDAEPFLMKTFLSFMSAQFIFALTFFSLTLSTLRADDWPQWLGPKRDAVWRESGIVEKFPESGLKVRWRVPIGGGYAGPAVARGRVYVMDRQLAKGATNPANAFARGEIPGSERVLCLNEADGKILWQHEN
jgi:hypothetical protein